MKKPKVLAGLFLVSAALLTLEIVLSRLASVVLYYHFSYYIIAMALLGGSSGGLVVYLFPDYFSENRAVDRMFTASLVLAVLLPLFVVGFLLLPSMIVDSTHPQNYYWVMQVLGVVLFVPFALGGVVVTLGIIRSGMPVGYTYGINLIGSTVGCLMAIAFLETVDGGTAVLLTASLVGAGSLFFLFHEPKDSAVVALVAGLVFLLLFAGMMNAFSDPPFLRPWYRGGEKSRTPLYQEWNSYSLVEVSPTISSKLSEVLGVGPFGEAPGIDPATTVTYRLIFFNGNPISIMLKNGNQTDKYGFLDWSLTNFVYQLKDRGPTAVLAAGGGRGVSAALRQDLKPIYGVDTNEIIVGLHTRIMPKFSGLASVQDVNWVNRDARRFLEFSDRKYNIISMGFLDFWTSFSGGKGEFALSGNGLYTVDSWRTIFGRLKPDGYFSVTRWYLSNTPTGALEAGRLFNLARRALWELGAKNPRDHVVLVGRPPGVNVIVSRSPLTPGDRRRITGLAGRLGFDVLLAPWEEPSGFLGRLARASTPGALDRTLESLSLKYESPRDEHPYFFNFISYSYLWEHGFFGGKLQQGFSTFSRNIRALHVLHYSILVSFILIAVTLILPLFLRYRDLKSFEISELLIIFGYFGLVGIAFMFIEIGLLSRLNIFLGHPIWSMSMVLGGMIFCTGAGSFVSERFDPRSMKTLLLYPLLIGFTVLSVTAGMETLLDWSPPNLTWRLSVAFVIVGVISLPLGLAFPVGLRFVSLYSRKRKKGTDLTPWLFGLNGGFSVFASGLALAIAIQWGVYPLFLSAGVLYLLLIFFLPFLEYSRL